MKTALIPATKIGNLDERILQKLKAKTAEMHAIKKERMIVGIRNEYHQIYRVIGITGLEDFLYVISELSSWNLIDELEDATGPKDGYDAIFRMPER